MRVLQIDKGRLLNCKQKIRSTKSGSHKEVCLWYVGLLRCKQIIIADRKSAGDCFILFDKLEFIAI